MRRDPTVRDFCLGILEQGGLAAKLAPPAGAPSDLRDPPGPEIALDRPARDPELTLRDGAGALPAPGSLRNRGDRARCLARFAHHELMAVELFAWALLRWPDLPTALRRSWLGVLLDEQRHCRLYLDRLAEHGSTLSDHACSDYFWRHVPAIAASPAGPRAFLAAMGLTLEQANLDFTLLYRDAFREAGDEESARVCQRVHDDEVAHVRLAATWLRALGPSDLDEIAAYRDSVPFPLSAARAKGRRFDVAARQRAGLGEEFIAYVGAARSSQESGRRP